MISPKTKMGVEIELQHLGPAAVSGLKPWLDFTVHDDGSIRGRTYAAGTISIAPEFDRLGDPILSTGMNMQDRNFGLEVVTIPYPYEQLVPLMDKSALHLGCAPQTARTSVHIHVDVANEPWTYVRNVLLWAHALEAPLFRLACGGGTHRGERDFNGVHNDHKYARPLSNPIGISWDEEILPLVDWDALNNAGSASEFAAAWGRLDMYWRGGITHYCPHRLHSVNFASVLRQGTLEWRLFDGLYEHLGLFTRLVYGVHVLAAQGAPDFAPMLLDCGDKPPIDSLWMSRLLDMDCGSLWGERWPGGCRTRSLRSHYPDAPVLMPLNIEPIKRISTVNKPRLDNGKPDFVLYERDED